MSSSKYLDATAGFDAVSQSVESLFSIKSNNESVSFAKKGLKILLDNSENFTKNKIFLTLIKWLLAQISQVKQ